MPSQPAFRRLTAPRAPRSPLEPDTTGVPSPFKHLASATAPRIGPGVITEMAERADVQAEAARLAARAREAIAKRIATLVPKVEKEGEAQVVLHLAEAYANLAAEPPRTRAG